MVVYVLKHLDLIRYWLRTRIREFYGTGDRDMCHFSVRSYLEGMLQDKVWGDMICCYILASMWGCILTIPNGSDMSFHSWMETSVYFIGSFGLSTKEPYTVMICLSCIIGDNVCICAHLPLALG